MKLIPFSPTKATELVPGVAMISKKNPDARWKIVKPTEPWVVRGTVYRDDAGNPTGFVHYWPINEEYNGEEPWVFLVKSMSNLKSKADIYKIEP